MNTPMRRYWSVIGLALMAICTLLSAYASGAKRRVAPLHSAGAILRRSGVEGGLVVHVGCGDGRLLAALGANQSLLVHGLDRNRAEVRSARSYLHEKDLYGRVSVEQWDGKNLPYANNLVDLLLVEEQASVSRSELLRVLSPEGTLYVRSGDGWSKTVKPWPEDIDEWTHFLYDSTNNAVSNDTKVGPPRYLQWKGSPTYSRSHEHLSSTSSVVSAGGRVFYIIDRGPPPTVAMPSEWYLEARDAFNGVRLWQKRIKPWAYRLRGFRTGPPHLARRLVATDDTVFATLGYGKPVCALNAETGRVIQTYEETEAASEMVYRDGVLYVVTEDPRQQQKALRAIRRGTTYTESGSGLVAIRAGSGELMWKKEGGEMGYIMPTTLAVADGRAYYQNTHEVVCLDAATGRRKWASQRPVSRSRLSWSTPTLVVRDGVVISADRDSSAVTGSLPSGKNGVQWVEESRGGIAPRGKLIAFSADTGRQLWSSSAKEVYNAPVDVLVSRGLLWTGTLVGRNEPGFTEGRRLLSGQVGMRRPADSKFFTVGFVHHRCYRNKATPRYIILGRSGVELVNLQTGEARANHWTRGACQYGVMPANGMIYTPPHPCACYIRSKLTGFNALAPRTEARAAAAHEINGPRLRKGPAYGNCDGESAESGEWPTYRHDAARSGRAGCTVPADLAQAWTAECGEPPSPPVIAGGSVYVTTPEDYRLHCLDAETGREKWTYTAGGRIDSPPTVYRGKVLFGCADGRVYCLRASDGALAWRFQAAPGARRIVDFNRLESAWPVHGNVLVQDGAAYFAAGRCSYLDDGIYLYGLDPRTGEKLFRKQVYSRDPETGLEPQDKVQGTSMPGALPDILSGNGSSIFMRHKRFSLEGKELKQDVPHIYSSSGFLDDTWWHRTYWQYGTNMASGAAGYFTWLRAGNRRISGRILVRDGEDFYGYGRESYGQHGAHVGIDGKHYRLFASRLTKDGHTYRWKKRPPFWVRSMVLAGDTLFAAGPPVPPYLHGGKEGRLMSRGNWYGRHRFTASEPREAMKAWRGEKGSRLWAISTRDGQKLDSLRLDSTPVFDSLAAAHGALYLSTERGTVICFRGK